MRVPLLNFEGVPGPKNPGPGFLVPLLNHVIILIIRELLELITRDNFIILKTYTFVYRK